MSDAGIFIKYCMGFVINVPIEALHVTSPCVIERKSPSLRAAEVSEESVAHFQEYETSRP